MVKAEMVYNLDDFRMLSRKAAWIARLRIPIMLVSIAAAVLVMFLLLTNTEYKYFLFTAFVILIAGMLLYTKWYVDFPEKNYRKIRALNGDIPDMYTFDSETMTVSFSSAGRCSVQKYKYEYCVQCIETENHFFIYTSRYYLEIIRKDSFTEGTAEDLRTILKEKLGNRYILKRGGK